MVVKKIGILFSEIFHYIALFAIGILIVVTGVTEYALMVKTGSVTLHDILLLFIYLELGAIIGIYFKTNHMPVRFLIYVSVTGLTRMMLEDSQVHQQPSVAILYASGGILMLSVATLLFRYGSYRYPSKATQRDLVGDD